MHTILAVKARVGRMSTCESTTQRTPKAKQPWTSAAASIEGNGVQRNVKGRGGDSKNEKENRGVGRRTV